MCTSENSSSWDGTLLRVLYGGCDITRVSFSKPCQEPSSLRWYLYLSTFYIKHGRAMMNSASQLIVSVILWFHCSFCPSWSFGSCRVAWGQFFRCSFSFANFLLDYLVLLSWLSCYLRFNFGHVRLFIALKVIRSHVCLIILLPTILSVALNQVFFFCSDHFGSRNSAGGFKPSVFFVLICLPSILLHFLTISAFVHVGVSLILLATKRLFILL